ncbi:hypothetical protein AB0H82_12410 [Streptomyces sp. NPDC050732]|uniref:hypothetical protein n=1 Tax=Streptomyces sp. NPDC050732 TaxID=3154632 RepID=UPI00341452AF
MQDEGDLYCPQEGMSRTSSLLTHASGTAHTFVRNTPPEPRTEQKRPISSCSPAM